MKQILKNSSIPLGKKTEKTSKPSKKRVVSSKKETSRLTVPKDIKRPKDYTKKKHPKFGTSKLESDFAKDFLDKLGIKYVTQFEAKEIGRFFDFYLPNSNLIIEIDGDYWHYNEEVFKGKKPNKTQVRDMRVDEYKNKWALMHSIPIMRIWENDIRKHPSEVLGRLKERLYIQTERIKINEEKKKRHLNILNDINKNENNK